MYKIDHGPVVIGHYYTVIYRVLCCGRLGNHWVVIYLDVIFSGIWNSVSRSRHTTLWRLMSSERNATLYVIKPLLDTKLSI